MRERDRRRKKGRELEEETEFEREWKKERTRIFVIPSFFLVFSPSISSYFTVVHFHPVVVLAYIYKH